MRPTLLVALRAVEEGMILLRAGNATVNPRMSKGRIHKAFSAEAILSHVLRQRAWTKLFRHEALTGKQHLSLLEDVRQYGRAWLRHEAEAFFDRYGVEDDLEMGRSLHGDNRDMHELGSDLLRTEGSPLVAEISRGIAERAQGVGDDGLRPAMGTSVPLRSSSHAGEDHSWSRDNDAVHNLDTQERGIAERAAGALGRFFKRAHQFIHELIIAGSMALKGSSTLSAGEISALDRQARVQAEYLQRFEREVTLNPPLPILDLTNQTVIVMPPPMTPGEFIARSESYGNSVWQVQNIGRAVVLAQKVFVAERRVHRLSELEHRPCTTCISQSRLGWQAPGVLYEIGDSECMNNCDCYFEWQDPKGKIFVSPWGRHNPKGYNQPGELGTRLPGIAYPPDQPAIPSLPSGPGPQEKPKRPPAPPKVVEPEPVDALPYPDEEYESAAEWAKKHGIQ